MRATDRFLAWIPVAALLLSSAALADDFHVESKVFEVGKEEPISESATIFQGGKVYDFLAASRETTIFDSSRGRLVVLDAGRKLRTEVTTADIKSFSDKLRIEAAGSPAALLNFLANPKFDDQSTPKELVLESHWLSYRIRTAPAPTPQVAKQYAEFSHWHAQFNSMINPGSIPPFGRLAVNQILENRQLLPVEVQMTLEDAGRRVAMRAEHRFRMQLVESDRRRILEAGNELAAFTAVAPAEYHRRVTEARQLPPATSRQK